MNLFVKTSRLLVVILAAVAACKVARASATNIYIAQVVAGSANGSSCANAYAYTFFNSAGSWGTGSTQIGPGTTVHVCGTVSNQLVFNGSGSSGNVITLLFEPGAMLSASATVWNANSPIWMENDSYILINGGLANTGGATPNIQATDNGSTLAHQLPITGIAMGGASNIEVKNLGCANLYVHNSVSDTALSTDSASCIDANPQGANLTIHDSTFHDQEDGLLFSVANAGNLNMQVYNMNMYNMDHSIFTTCNSSTASGFYVHDNQIHDPANWDTTSNTYHHNGWILNSVTGQTCTGLYDYNNAYGGDWGNNNTSPIFLDNNGGNFDTVYVFNDVFLNTDTLHPWGNGINLIAGNSASGDGPVHVWNNTVVCGAIGGAGMQVDGQNVDFRNNVESGCAQFFNTSNGTSSTISAIDYNYYSNLVPSGGSAFSFLSSSSGAGSFAAQFSHWQTVIQSLLPGAESHSGQGSTAGLTSTGVSQSGAATIGVGLNLCNGIVSCTGALAALVNTTSAGNTVTPAARPTTGAWDIGAYQFGSGSSGSGTTPSPLAPPSSLATSAVR